MQCNNCNTACENMTNDMDMADTGNKTSLCGYTFSQLKFYVWAIRIGQEMCMNLLTFWLMILVNT